MTLDKNKIKIQKQRKSERSKKLWKDPEYRRRVIKNSIKTRSTPEYRLKASQWQKKNWKNDVFRNNILTKSKKTKSSIQFRKKASKKRIQMWKDPIYRKNVTIGITNAARTSARRKKSSVISLKLWKDPKSNMNTIETNAKRRAKAIAQWEDPVIRARCIAAIKKGKQNPKAIAHLKKVLNTPKHKALKRQQRLHQIFPKKDSKPEKILQAELIKRNIQFKKHVPLIGQPDIFIEPNICIFADGDYWHANPAKYKGTDLLIGNTLAKDKWNYDKSINKKLRNQNYNVIRFWEKEIKRDIKSIVDKLEIFIINENTKTYL